MIENNMSAKVNQTFQQSDEKHSKFLSVKTNYDCNLEPMNIDVAEYNTNSMVVHPKKQDKVQNSLFKINQRRFRDNPS